MINDVLISSFKREEIFKIHQINPKIKLATLFLGFIRKKNRIAEANKYNLFALHPYYRFASDKFIKNAHKKGIKINTWTVDSPEKIKSLIDKGVDGIITNDVKTAQRIIQ